MSFFVYLLASKPHGTLYCGSTDDLVARVWQHREKLWRGFTAQYSVTKLVWFEVHDTRDAGFTRERRMKEWPRAWKVRLIERENPGWRDLWDELNAP